MTLVNDATTLTRSDFTVGHIVSLVGRELSGIRKGSIPSEESKMQELIQAATQVDEWDTTALPARKGRSLTHHVWWGVVVEDQKRDESHPKTVLLKWLCVTPPAEGDVVVELGPSKAPPLLLTLDEDSWIMCKQVPCNPHASKAHTYLIHNTQYTPHKTPN